MRLSDRAVAVEVFGFVAVGCDAVGLAGAVAVGTLVCAFGALSLAPPPQAARPIRVSPTRTVLGMGPPMRVVGPNIKPGTP